MIFWIQTELWIPWFSIYLCGTKTCWKQHNDWSFAQSVLFPDESSNMFYILLYFKIILPIFSKYALWSIANLLKLTTKIGSKFLRLNIYNFIDHFCPKSRIKTASLCSVTNIRVDMPARRTYLILLDGVTLSVAI